MNTFISTFNLLRKRFVNFLTYLRTSKRGDGILNDIWKKCGIVTSDLLCFEY